MCFFLRFLLWMSEPWQRHKDTPGPSDWYVDRVDTSPIRHRVLRSQWPHTIETSRHGDERGFNVRNVSTNSDSHPTRLARQCRAAKVIPRHQGSPGIFGHHLTFISSFPRYLGWKNEEHHNSISQSLQLDFTKWPTVAFFPCLKVWNVLGTGGPTSKALKHVEMRCPIFLHAKLVVNFTLRSKLSGDCGQV